MHPAKLLGIPASLGGLSLLLVAASAARSAPCPESCATNSAEGTLCSSLATRDHSTQTICSPVPGTSSTHETWNLVLGTIRVSASSCYSGNASVDVIARDRFRIVGPASAPPIAFQARLRTNGGAGEFGSVGAGLREVGGESRWVDGGFVGGFDADLLLPLSHAVGEEFDLVYEVHADAYPTATTQGQLSFVGLPAGYGVTSCQGFAGDGAVPAKRTSWGAVKNIYR